MAACSDRLHLLFELFLGQAGPFSVHPGLSAHALKTGQFDLPKELLVVREGQDHHDWPAIFFHNYLFPVSISPRDDFSELQASANFFLGMSYHALGDYPQAMDYCRRNVTSRDVELRYERFGLYFLSVSSRTFLVWCLAELGMFTQGVALAEEAVRIAEAADHPYSCIQAYYGVGLLYIRKGEHPKATPALERALQLCHLWEIPIWLPWTASALGKAYALAGRMSEALLLLEQAVERAAAMGLMVYQSLLHAWLSEAHLVARHQREALMIARQALDLARAHRERGHEAWILHLLGEIACHYQPLNPEEAEAYYHQALALALALGMHPLLAHCHMGLGTLYTKVGRRKQVRAELSAAIELFHAMEMTFWQARAEAILSQTS